GLTGCLIAFIACPWGALAPMNPGSRLKPLLRFPRCRSGFSRDAVKSGVAQVPAPVLLADLAHELAIFGTLDREKDLEELLAESLPRPLGMLQRVDRRRPLGRQVLRGLGIAVALDRRAGIEVLADAPVNPGQNGRGGKIGVGIGATDAVLDVSGVGRTTGYAQADGAVVHTPGGRQRCVAVGLEAPVGVGVGAE